MNLRIATCSLGLLAAVVLTARAETGASGPDHSLTLVATSVSEWSDWPGGAVLSAEGGWLIPADAGDAVLHASGGELVSDEAGESFYSGFEEVEFTLVPGGLPPGVCRVTLVVRGFLPTEGGEPDGMALIVEGGKVECGAQNAQVTTLNIATLDMRRPARSERTGDTLRYTWEGEVPTDDGFRIVWRLPSHASFDALELEVIGP